MLAHKASSDFLGFLYNILGSLAYSIKPFGMIVVVIQLNGKDEVLVAFSLYFFRSIQLMGNVKTFTLHNVFILPLFLLVASF